LTHTEHWREINRNSMRRTSLLKEGTPSSWPPCPRWHPVHSYSPAEPTVSCCRRGQSTCRWCKPAQTHPLPGTATCTGSNGRRRMKAESTCNRQTCVTNVPKLRRQSLICPRYIRKVLKQSWIYIWILHTVPLS
jgi:hypothetical protein